MTIDKIIPFNIGQRIFKISNVKELLLFNFDEEDLVLATKIFIECDGKYDAFYENYNGKKFKIMDHEPPVGVWFREFLAINTNLDDIYGVIKRYERAIITGRYNKIPTSILLHYVSAVTHSQLMLSKFMATWHTKWGYYPIPSGDKVSIFGPDGTTLLVKQIKVVDGYVDFFGV